MDQTLYYAIVIYSNWGGVTEVTVHNPWLRIQNMNIKVSTIDTNREQSTSVRKDRRNASTKIELHQSRFKVLTATKISRCDIAVQKRHQLIHKSTFSRSWTRRPLCTRVSEYQKRQTVKSGNSTNVEVESFKSNVKVEGSKSSIEPNWKQRS